MSKMKADSCKTRDCTNPVLSGKYCEFCKKKRKEKRNKIIAGAGSATATIAYIALTVFFRKPPNIRGK